MFDTLNRQFCKAEQLFLDWNFQLIGREEMTAEGLTASDFYHLLLLVC